MTEQEIVDYLKKNKSEGRIISFMPDEVKRWCEKHMEELLVWQSHRWHKFDAVGICTDDAVTLYDDYEIKEESKGGWVELNIDENGDYNLKYDGTVCYEGERRGYGIPWSDWEGLLRLSSREGWSYTAFGGWQYKDDKRWYLAPAVKLKDGKMWNSYIIEESGEATPVIPVKIRFWREIK